MSIYFGTFLDTPHLGQLRVREYAAIFVDSKGVIRRILDLSKDLSQAQAAKVKETLRDLGYETAHIVHRFSENDGVRRKGRRWWFPGFIGES